MAHSLILGLLLLFLTPSTQEEGIAEAVGRDTCLACHELTGGFLSSTHGEAECEACHGPGSLHMDAGDLSLSLKEVSPDRLASACLSCHGQSQGKVSHFRQGPHFRSQISCAQCHQVHPEKANFGLLKVGDSTQLCASCHHSVEAAFRKPYHHPVLEGGMRCLDCHNPHAERESSYARLELVPENGCLSCHADKKGPFIFEHASAAVNGCMSCHQPHGSFNSKMLIRNEVHQLCLECHSMTGGFAGSQPPSLHDLRSPRYRNCTVCHREIHGSNVNPAFLR